MNHTVVTRANLDQLAKKLAHGDKHLAAVYDRLGPPKLWKRPATYATFVRIILEQQVSLESAKATFDRLRGACESRVTAANVAALEENGLQQLGFTRQKARYTYALAQDVLTKEFRVGALLHQDDQQARTTITSRVGLGSWTADVYLLMALCRTDVFPVGDLALIKGMRELDGGAYETSDQLLARAESWRPYRSVATRMVWQLYLSNRNKSAP